MGKLETNKKKKKDALFNTAFELFTTKGLAHTTISDIVEKAGVAKGTFYLYFKDKYDIRNKLVAHKADQLFAEAYDALLEIRQSDFEEQILFIVDYLLARLQKDRSLLLFISKNLSWGVFRDFLVGDDTETYPFYQTYLELLQKSDREYENPELMLFTIVELVSSTCYSCILQGQPVTIETYKPYLYRTIRDVLRQYAVSV